MKKQSLARPGDNGVKYLHIELLYEKVLNFPVKEADITSKNIVCYNCNNQFGVVLFFC